MDRIEKFLRKVSKDRRRSIEVTLVNILDGKVRNLDIKKLKGCSNLFRVRAGDIRIVFSQDEEITQILFIGKRGDSKYKQF